MEGAACGNVNGGSNAIHNQPDELLSLFDSVTESFEDGASYRAMARLVDGLAELRQADRTPAWVQGAKDLAGRHAIGKLVLECPFTRHSAQKPRGYPGDAQLIDFIYRHPASVQPGQATTRVGRNVLLHNIDSPAPAAVRARRHLMATYIADLASKRDGCHILSVACGHARELELLDEDVVRRIARFVAFDQDAASLEVAASYAACGIPVEPVNGTILQLMRDPALNSFDLIFSAGLYDYLSDRLSRKLTANLFKRLKPGGKLIVANFLPNIRDAAYMEVFMDWRLIYRTEDEIRKFAAHIPASDLGASKYFTEPNRNVGFLELSRR